MALGQGGLRIRNAPLMKAIRDALAPRYANLDEYIFKYTEARRSRDAILNGNVYFNLTALLRDGVNLSEFANAAGEAVLKVPGVARYFTRAQLERCLADKDVCATCSQKSQHADNSRCSNDRMLRSVARGYFPERSGDLIIIQKEFNYLGDGVDPANHGTPYSYDTHVPVIVMGEGVKRGRYTQRITPADVAPTLSFMLGMPAPNKSQGRVLREAIFQR